MRVIIVHTVEHAIIALEAGKELGKKTLLQSAPDAIFYAGSLYLHHMYEQAKLMVPGAESIFILDCSDASSEALAAMQMGHTHLRSAAPEETRVRLADIAAQYNIAFYDGEFEGLDLAYARDAEKACREWLKNH